MRYVFAIAAIALVVLLTSPPQSAHAAFFDCDPVGACLGTDDADDMNGTPGYDEIRGYGGADDIRGYGSGDDLYGGSGDDIVVGYAGDDYMRGGWGDDLMKAASDDSGGDFVDCGPGFDEVWADPGDAVSPDCELVHTIF